MTTSDLAILADKWATALRSEGKARNTINTYLAAVRVLAAWQQAAGRTGLDLETARAFIAAILDGGGAETTASSRTRALRAFSSWLAAEGITDGNVLAGLKAPRPGKRIVPRLSDEDIAALLATCEGTGFTDRRDEALIRFMAGTGARAEEVLSMDLGADLDMGRQLVVFRKTKGNRERAVPFSAAVRACLAAYLDARAGRGLPAGSGPAWISERGGRLDYTGMATTLRRRAARAGVAGFHVHRFRHTFAANWLRAGGSQLGLMKVAGWTKLEMVERYTEDCATDLAIEEARQLMG